MGPLEIADLWVNLASARALSHGSLGKLCLLSLSELFWGMDISKHPSSRTVARIQGDHRLTGPEGKGFLNVGRKWASFQGLGAQEWGVWALRDQGKFVEVSGGANAGFGGSLGCEDDTTSHPTEKCLCSRIHHLVCTRQELHQKVKDTS